VSPPKPGNRYGVPIGSTPRAWLRRGRVFLRTFWLPLVFAWQAIDALIRGQPGYALFVLAEGVAFIGLLLLAVGLVDRRRARRARRERA
jgi:hypothetical protein